ncbi:MAG: DUF1674 domain-containing protein [Pseudomonadota bacterium]
MANEARQNGLAQHVAPARKRPAHVTAPAHWKADPAPRPEPITEEDEKRRANGPTRYGDWESNGIAIDF